MENQRYRWALILSIGNSFTLLATAVYLTLINGANMLLLAVWGLCISSLAILGLSHDDYVTFRTIQELLEESTESNDGEEGR